MVKKKQVVIDLTNYGNQFAGFGQIANNYAKYFAEKQTGDIQLIYLLPKDCDETFGDHILSIPCTSAMKTFSFLMPKADVWHSVNHQQKRSRVSRDTKYIFTIHDLNFLTEKKPWKAKVYLKKMQKRVDKATVVTAISHYTAEMANKHLNLKDKEIRVIHNGIEPLNPAEEKKPAFVSDRPFFFTVGQIRRKKNFHLLVDVMQSFPEYDLYICGDDHFDFAEEVRQRIQSSKASNVFLPGMISQSEKIWLYNHCQAFLFPSEGEGFGLPAIEAMQFGKAVFAANRTSLPEVCGGHAILWDDLDPAVMAASIHKHLPGFYDDKERIEKIKKYASSFSYEKHVQAYLDIYKELTELI